MVAIFAGWLVLSLIAGVAIGTAMNLMMQDQEELQ